MAAENMIFDQEVVPSADAYGKVGMYFANSSHVVTGFQHSFSTVPSGCPDVGLLVAGIGMAPATFVMPEGALAAAGYGAVEAVPVEVPAPRPRQPRPAGADGEVVPFRGAWTKQEDNILKEMVRKYGDRKWAAIADHLPDRIGKQCRERWTNHLRPDLKKDIWTQHDDRVLIEAHKTYGNRWSAIARCLPGRSENAVKNHWNATKRSLTSQRRFKKKKSEQAAPGQFTLLEEYIRTQPPATVTEPTAPAPQPSSILGHYGRTEIIPYAAAEPAPDSNLSGMGMYVDNSAAGSSVNLNMPAPQPSSILGNYGDPGIIPHAAAETAPGSNLPGMGMYVDISAARSSMNLNMPALPDLNAYGSGETQEPCYHTVPFGCRPSCNLNYGGGGLQQMTINGGDAQAAYTNLNLFPIPFAENLASDVVVADQLECQSYGGGYYSEAAGPSSAGGSSDPDDIDVVQMASREFLTPSEDEVTLDLTRFKRGRTDVIGRAPWYIDLR